MKRNLSLFITFYAIAALLISACAKTGQSYFYGALGVGETRIILNSSSGLFQNTTIYSGEGKFLGVLADYITTGGTPRGLAYLSPICFLSAIEGTDQIDKHCLDQSTPTVWGRSSLITSINGLQVLPNGKVLVTDGNTIEMYSTEGIRIPPTGATPYINTTVGGCVLSGPVRMTLNSNDQLVVTNPTNERVNIYDLTTTSPTCVTSVTLPSNDPQAVLAHSDGNLYISTILNTNETIWKTDALGGSPVAIFQNETALMVDAYAIAELPNGNLLISSVGTDSLIEIDTDGNFIKIFAKDSHTADVQDILILSGASQ